MDQGCPDDGYPDMRIIKENLEPAREFITPV